MSEMIRIIAGSHLNQVAKVRLANFPIRSTRIRINEMTRAILTNDFPLDSMVAVLGLKIGYSNIT
jgi:hypothetical protein